MIKYHLKTNIYCRITQFTNYNVIIVQLHFTSIFFFQQYALTCLAPFMRWSKKVLQRWTVDKGAEKKGRITAFNNDQDLIYDYFIRLVCHALVLLTIAAFIDIYNNQHQAPPKKEKEKEKRKETKCQA